MVLRSGYHLLVRRSCRFRHGPCSGTSFFLFFSGVRNIGVFGIFNAARLIFTCCDGLILEWSEESEPREDGTGERNAVFSRGRGALFVRIRVDHTFEMGWSSISLAGTSKYEDLDVLGGK